MVSVVKLLFCGGGNEVIVLQYRCVGVRMGETTEEKGTWYNN